MQALFSFQALCPETGTETEQNILAWSHVWPGKHSCLLHFLWCTHNSNTVCLHAAPGYNQQFACTCLKVPSYLASQDISFDSSPDTLRAFQITEVCPTLQAFDQPVLQCFGEISGDV